ncbi:MAG: hypothetical protein AB1724_15240 [Thermodesulfobacteriota bacterium]
MTESTTTLAKNFVESKRLEAVIKKTWYLFYSQGDAIAKQPASQLPQNAHRSALLFRQQPVAILARIPWWHNVVIIQKCSTVEQTLFYALSDIHKPMGVVNEE